MSTPAAIPPYATTAGTKTETTGITTAAVKPKVSDAPTARKTVLTTKIMKEPMH